jgi:allantoicase
MPTWELKRYRVMARSWINGAIAEPGEIVTIKVDTETWHHDANLVEVTDDVVVGHTEAQKKAADEASKAREENIAKSEAKQEADEAAATHSTPSAPAKTPAAPPAGPGPAHV